MTKKRQGRSLKNTDLGMTKLISPESTSNSNTSTPNSIMGAKFHERQEDLTGSSKETEQESTEELKNEAVPGWLPQKLDWSSLFHEQQAAKSAMQLPYVAIPN
ncbi:hypothetical protein Ancab_000382 [Ancistrocladus abbreviatus]